MNGSGVTERTVETTNATGRNMADHKRHLEPIMCAECELPAFSLAGRALVVKNRHHGETHTTIVSLDELFEQPAQTFGRTVVKIESGG